jgi:hypothetical protein
VVKIPTGQKSRRSGLRAHIKRLWRKGGHLPKQGGHLSKRPFHGITLLQVQTIRYVLLISAQLNTIRAILAIISEPLTCSTVRDDHLHTEVHRRYIGGVSPSLPMFTRGASSVPSACLLAATMKIFAPGFRSVLSPGAMLTMGVSDGTTIFFSPPL